MRRLQGGGSLSTRLFQDEELRDLEIDGARAWAVRHGSAGPIDPVGFVRKGGAWSVRLRAGRRRDP